MEVDPAEVLHNEANAQIDAEVLKLIEQYAGCDVDSDALNERRAVIRKKAEKRGFSSLEFQEAVRKLKKMSKSERLQHERNVKRIIAAADGRQAEFWPAEAKKADERAKRRREQAAKEAAAAGKETPEQQERRLAADNNPRSDPARGGAKPSTAVEAAEAESERRRKLQEAAAAAPGATPPDVPGEQEEGEKALAAAMPKTKQAQSAKAAEKLAAAKLN